MNVANENVPFWQDWNFDISIFIHCQTADQTGIRIDNLINQVSNSISASMQRISKVFKMTNCLQSEVNSDNAKTKHVSEASQSTCSMTHVLSKLSELKHPVNQQIRSKEPKSPVNFDI